MDTGEVSLPEVDTGEVSLPGEFSVVVLVRGEEQVGGADTGVPGGEGDRGGGAVAGGGGLR